MPRGFLVKRFSYLSFPSQDKPLFLNKVRSPASSSSNGSASSCGLAFSPRSDRPESPEPQVLDLRISSIVYSPSLHSITQVPSVIRKPKLSNPTRSSLGQKRKSPGQASSGKVKKQKAIRRLTFDDRKSSPVSGTIIKYSDSEEDDDKDLIKSSYIHRTGDIDPCYNIVIVSDEARAELAKIENRIGDYNCMLCRDHFSDAFALAQHRCPRIIHIEYRCTECEKVFNCPANLASHRRWHKPRVGKVVTEASLTTATKNFAA